MIPSVRFTVALLCVLLSVQVVERASAETPSIKKIKEASVRRICYDSYWRGEDILLGKEIIFKMSVEGDRFFLWIDDLALRDGTRLSVFQEGIILNQRAFITLEEQYNSPPPFSYEAKQKHFTKGKVLRDTLIIPSNCTPQYDPPSAKKERMVSTIVNTMKFGLSFSKDSSIGHTVQFDLIIADFNVDYPYTYVLIEPSKELYIVTLHDYPNWESDEYEKEGNYPYRKFNEEDTKNLLKKIREHGIVYRIAGTPISK